MPAFNAFQYVMHFRRIVLGQPMTIDSSPAISDWEIIEHLNLAYGEIQSEFKISTERNTESQLLAGTSEYLRPWSTFGNLNRSIRVKNRNGTGSYPLIYMEWGKFEQLFNAEQTPQPTGSPVYWTYSWRDQSKIQIGPTPDYTYNNGLIFEMPRAPEPLTQFFNQTAVTMSATMGLGTVEFSAPGISPELIFAGNDIGVPRNLQLDGATFENQTPNQWYTIIGVTTDPASPWNNNVKSCVISPVWRQQTIPSVQGSPPNPGVRFVSAQRSDIEDACPWAWGLAPVYKAASIYLESTEPEKSGYFQAKYRDLVSRAPTQAPQVMSYANGNILRMPGLGNQSAVWGPWGPWINSNTPGVS